MRHNAHGGQDALQVHGVRLTTIHAIIRVQQFGCCVTCTMVLDIVESEEGTTITPGR